MVLTENVSVETMRSRKERSIYPMLKCDRDEGEVFEFEYVGRCEWWI